VNLEPLKLGNKEKKIVDSLINYPIHWKTRIRIDQKVILSELETKSNKKPDWDQNSTYPGYVSVAYLRDEKVINDFDQNKYLALRLNKQKKIVESYQLKRKNWSGSKVESLTIYRIRIDEVTFARVFNFYKEIGESLYFLNSSYCKFNTFLPGTFEAFILLQLNRLLKDTPINKEINHLINRLKQWRKRNHKDTTEFYKNFAKLIEKIRATSFNLITFNGEKRIVPSILFIRYFDNPEEFRKKFENFKEDKVFLEYFIESWKTERDLIAKNKDHKDTCQTMIHEFSVVLKNIDAEETKTIDSILSFIFNELEKFNRHDLTEINKHLNNKNLPYDLSKLNIQKLTQIIGG